MAITPKIITLTDGRIRYRVRFRLGATGSPVSETFDTPEGAYKFIELIERVGGAEARRIRAASDRSHDSTPTLRTAFTEHLDALAASATPGTIDSYRAVAERTWLPRLGHLPIDQITEEDVRQWISWQRRQETRNSIRARTRAKAAGTAEPAKVLYSSKSIKNAHGVLSSTFNHAIKTHKGAVIAHNPAKGLPLPKDDVPDEMTIITPNQWVALYDAIPDQWKPLALLLYTTGMRFGEATALTAAEFDLDADEPTVRVRQAWKEGAGGKRYLGAPKSRRSRRTISLPPETVAVMRTVLEKRPTGMVFQPPTPATEYLRIQYFYAHVWRPAVKKSGITIRPRIHDLRHTHASWLLSNGIPVHVVQRRLGHEDAKVTLNTYSHVLPDAMGAAAAVASLAVTQALPEIEG